MHSVIDRNQKAFARVIDVLLEVRDDFRELKAESRAQTRAVFQMLDRFGNGGAEPAGA